MKLKYDVKETRIQRENGSLRIIHHFDHGIDPVQQQFKDETDINHIMKRYIQGVPITHINEKLALYGDFTSVKDFNSALNEVVGAKQAFEELPSHIRNRFSNDPAQLFAFLGDKNNLDEAVKLGLKKPEATNAINELNDNANQPKATTKTKKTTTIIEE